MIGLNSTVESITFITVGILMVLILLKVLLIVHKQTTRVKELEAQMKLMDKSEEATAINAKEGETKNG